MRLRSTLVAASALPLFASASLAAEVVVENDSTSGGTPSTVANYFVPGESVASWLTATCDGDIVAAQVYWASQFGGAPTQLEQMLSILAAGTFPTPGAVLTNDGGANAEIPGPQLADGVMNEFRFLDPPSDTVAMKVPVTTGQTFVVSLQLLNQSSGDPFAPSVVYDLDGCQSQSNAVDVMPGGWSDACVLGVTGDWVIRAVVDCAAPSPVPASGGAGGALALSGLVVALGWLAARSARTAS